MGFLAGPIAPQGDMTSLPFFCLPSGWTSGGKGNAICQYGYSSSAFFVSWKRAPLSFLTGPEQTLTLDQRGSGDPASQPLQHQSCGNGVCHYQGLHGCGKALAWGRSVNRSSCCGVVTRPRAARREGTSDTPCCCGDLSHLSVPCRGSLLLSYRGSP